MAEPIFSPTICFGPGSEQNVDPRHSVRVEGSIVCDRPEQVGAQCVGPAICPSYVSRSCGCNEHRALTERHLAKQPEAPRTLRCPERLARAIRYCYVHQLLDFEEWLSKWPKAKQTAILDSLTYDSRDPSLTDAFVKLSSEHQLPSCPRLIQKHATLAAQAQFACEHSRFQKAIFEVLGGDRSDGFEVYEGVRVAGTSGWNASDLADWADRNAGADWWYERDGKRWDASQQRNHHDCKVGVIRPIDPDFARHLERCFRVRGKLRSRGRVRAKITYRSQGTVKSGYNDTTSGNSLVNACISAKALHAVGCRANIIVMGDDMLAAVWGPRIAENIASEERMYGIIPEYKVHDRAADASYCSGHFLYDGTRHLFVPNFGRSLARLFWTINPVSRRRIALHQHGVASCMLTTYPNHPWYRAWLGKYELRGRPAGVEKHKIRGPQADYGFDYERALCDRYGIEEREHHEIIRLLGSVRAPGWFWGECLRPISNRDIPQATVGEEAREEIDNGRDEVAWCRALK